MSTRMFQVQDRSKRSTNLTLLPCRLLQGREPKRSGCFLCQAAGSLFWSEVCLYGLDIDVKLRDPLRGDAAGRQRALVAEALLC